jgi:outer membrane protein insertion porin family
MRKRGCCFSVLFVLVALAVLPCFSAVLLDDVRVETPEKVMLDASFVQAYTSLRRGQSLEDEAALNAAVGRDVDSLRDSGRFSYVRAYVEQQGDRLVLVYNVVPRLRLSTVTVQGADQVGAKKVKRELGLLDGEYVDNALVTEKVRQLETFFQKSKFPGAKIEWELRPDESLQAAELVLTVDEGGKQRVRRIVIEGSRFLDDSRSARTGRFFKRLVPGHDDVQEDAFETRQVKKVLNQKSTWWITSWFGAYQPSLDDVDRAAIRKFYFDHGFIDAVVSGPDVVDLGDGDLELRYQVEEGDLYRISSISMEGNELFSKEVLIKQSDLNSGDVASQRAIDSAARNIGLYYGDRGYIRSYVRPDIKKDSESNEAAINFVVREGEKAYIGEITFRGNEKTRDEVMRRELAVYPGEQFNQRKVNTSENRIRNLGYFETVGSSYLSSSQTNTYDLTYSVKEKAMGSFLIGAGFSSVDALVGFAEVSHGNFDIKSWPPVGDGQKMKARVQIGSERNDVELSFVEPWFLDRKLALGVDLYSRESDYYSDEYTLSTLGGRVSVSKPLGPFVRGQIAYSLEEFDISGLSTNAPIEIQAEAGSRVKSAVSVSVSRDTRDQYFVPTRGARTSAEVELAGGPFAGDTDIYALQIRSSRYWSLWKEHVLNLRGAVRFVDEYGDSNDVPIFDRLFLGGPRTLRGFAYRDVSPRSVSDPDEPVGGKSSYYATAEYTVPLWEKIRGAVFYDIGAVNSDSFDFGTDRLNSDFGFGVRFDLPMFPLSLDYAFPHITDDDNEDAAPRWNFLLGYSF